MLVPSPVCPMGSPCGATHHAGLSHGDVPHLQEAEAAVHLQEGSAGAAQRGWMGPILCPMPAPRFPHPTPHCSPGALLTELRTHPDRQHSQQHVGSPGCQHLDRGKSVRWMQTMQTAVVSPHVDFRPFFRLNAKGHRMGLCTYQNEVIVLGFHLQLHAFEQEDLLCPQGGGDALCKDCDELPLYGCPACPQQSSPPHASRQHQRHTYHWHPAPLTHSSTPLHPSRWAITPPNHPCSPVGCRTTLSYTDPV